MNTSKLQFDARLWVVLNHISLLVSGIIFFNFQRTVSQIFWTVGTALSVDVVLRYFFRREDVSIRNLLSPAVTGLSLVLLLNSHSIFVYVFSVGASIVSKYVLCFDRKHFFNPSLFGIVVTYCYFDFGTFKIQYDQFMGIGYCALQLCILGFFTLYFARRLVMPVFYYVVLVGGAFFVSFFWKDTYLIELIGPELSASGILFAFFMMTDPVTSPSGWMKQIFFSVLCALISLVLTTNHVVHANFISLFFLNSFSILSNFKSNNKLESSHS